MRLLGKFRGRRHRDGPRSSRLGCRCLYFQYFVNIIINWHSILLTVVMLRWGWICLSSVCEASVMWKTASVSASSTNCFVVTCSKKYKKLPFEPVQWQATVTLSRWQIVSHCRPVACKTLQSNLNLLQLMPASQDNLEHFQLVNIYRMGIGGLWSWKQFCAKPEASGSCVEEWYGPGVLLFLTLNQPRANCSCFITSAVPVSTAALQ